MTPPALRSHSSGESGDARVKVFDLHTQQIFKQGEASGLVVNTLNAFADQIRVANQADATQLRLIVQRSMSKAL